MNLGILKEKPERYFDKLRILETKAAAYASLGDFEKAIKLQKKALKKAKNNNWKIPLINERLDKYEHKLTYTGSYY